MSCANDAAPRAGRRVLAGAADARAAARGRLPGRAAGRRRAGHAGGARAGASRGARAAARGGRPVAAPSANRSGEVSPTTARHVLDGLGGRIAAVLDSGALPGRCGIHRAGSDRRPAVPAAAGRRDGGGDRGDRRAGHARHPARDGEAAGLAVAGSAGVALRATPAGAARRRGGRGGRGAAGIRAALPGAGADFNLSQAGDLTEAAARLFEGLRWLDAEGARLGLARIAAMPVPATGLGLAIADRLQRAAAPRIEPAGDAGRYSRARNIRTSLSSRRTN